ncbi:hypothetical protein SAMN05216456_1284 [Devosia crocina]|uniref:Uncharacterized protein n=1 Tax=Devosia crocina TaxID=429728 RepID=A0A1I7N9B1_9HYPH|nr:hypothetical protein [Devosia crocina]SFV31262.1 hypothetical protein SAMN05216456_1284 [Devosia crocina]
MTSLRNGNQRGRVAPAMSLTTYVSGPSDKTSRVWIIVALIAMAALGGYHIGDQPHAMAACQAQHSADTCAQTLR